MVLVQQYTHTLERERRAWSGWAGGETKREVPWLYLGAEFCWRSGIASRLATPRRMAPSGLAEGFGFGCHGHEPRAHEQLVWVLPY